jgi:hypothetical protein
MQIDEMDSKYPNPTFCFHDYVIIMLEISSKTQAFVTCKI